MEFVSFTSSILFILYGLLAMTLILGFRLGFKYGGWNRHLVYLWTLIVHTQYLLVTPIVFYTEKIKIIIGTDISEYFGVGAFFNLIAMASFISGYWVLGTKTKDQWNAVPEKAFMDPQKWITILFYSLYAIVLINMAAGGIDVKNVFFGKEVVGLGAQGATYYVQNFTDSLITLIILAYLFDVPKRRLILWIAMAFFLFSILGFRYRILLTLFGIAFVYLFKNKVHIKHILGGVTVASCFLYLVMFSTENRRSLIMREYSTLEFNPAKFDYFKFFDQTRGAIADLAVYKLYDNPNKSARHDYGYSMFGYIFIRLIPRSILPNKDDYYPAPQIKTTIEAYDPYWGKFSGEATLSVAAIYINFGWLGLVFGYFLWALALRKYSNKVNANDKMSLIKYIILALVSFQWITRGYFPQAVDHGVYMLIPVFILIKLSQRKMRLQQATSNLAGVENERKRQLPHRAL